MLGKRRPIQKDTWFDFCLSHSKWSQLLTAGDFLLVHRKTLDVCPASSSHGEPQCAAVFN